MSSERVIYFSKSPQQIEEFSKRKLQRRSTRITNTPQINSQIILSESFNEDEVFELGLSPPSPVQSSEQASSAQVKYLSYLARVIDSAPEGSDSQQIQFHYHQSQYWHTVYECAIYVKKDTLRTAIDDNLILSQISQYLIQGRIHPQAKNQIGQQLLKNGYFLCAYAIATGRQRKSPFIFKYLMQYFHNQFQIETNYEEFTYFMENFVQKQKAQQILNLEYATTPGQNKSQNNQSNSNSMIKRHSEQNNLLQPIRRPFLRPINDQQSQDSKTINLDDLEQQDQII